MAEFGYAGEILKVDLSSGSITKLPTADYADRFIGGRGMAAKLYWDMVSPDTKALDPENCLICATGPVAGFPRFAGGRWQICGKSPAFDPEVFSYASMGERWGIRLKCAGYDSVAVQGKSDKPVYLYIHDGAVEIRDASPLWGKSTYETCYSLKAELGKGVNILTVGQAAENLVPFATTFTDEGSSGSGGLGGVMGSKKLKAIVAAGDRKPRAAEPDKLPELADYIAKQRKQFNPTNFPWIVPGRTKPYMCYQCGIGCTRQSYINDDGHRLRLYCQPIGIYRAPAERYYGDGQEIAFKFVQLLDRYGLDAIVIRPMLQWLTMCYEEGILNDEQTGLPLSKIGSVEFMETLIHKISYREGFGDLLARGTVKAAETLGERAKELITHMIATSASEGNDYDPRMILHNAMLYATEPRRPISQLHDAGIVLLKWIWWISGEKEEIVSSEVVRGIAERFWGTAAAADYTTYEGKALAAKKIQDRNHAKESLVVCDLALPILHTKTTSDHVGDPSIENQIYSLITGRETDEAGLNMMGERIFNLQRAILLRQGRGAREDDRLMDYLHEEPLRGTYPDPECRVPGKNGEEGSRRGAVVEREEFEKMKDEYYELRGWDVESGLQTVAKLEELQLGDIASDLQRRGLAK
jgi:aldehyde:ferredoxin oxidoreductase